MIYHYIKVVTQEHVCYLTLSRPDKRNAFTPTMVNEIDHALFQAETNSEIRLVVINAEGPVFCAGMDLNVFENPSLDKSNPYIQNKDISLGAAFAQLHKPSICIVEGDVYAGGFLIFLACTYVFAKPHVKFSLPEVKIGLFPFQVLASLLRHLPSNKALDMCIRACTYSALELKHMGIVFDLIEAQDDDNVKQLIHQLCLHAPLAIRKGFEAMEKLQELGESARYPYLLKALNDLKTSEDFKEGLVAQREKRMPNWKNK